MGTARTARDLRSDGAEARDTEGRLDQHHAEDLMIRDNGLFSLTAARVLFVEPEEPKFRALPVKPLAVRGRGKERQIWLLLQ